MDFAIFLTIIAALVVASLMFPYWAYLYRAKKHREAMKKIAEKYVPVDSYNASAVYHGRVMPGDRHLGIVDPAPRKREERSSSSDWVVPFVVSDPAPTYSDPSPSYSDPSPSIPDSSPSTPDFGGFGGGDSGGGGASGSW